MKNILKIGIVSFAFGLFFISADTVNGQTRRGERREYRGEVRDARRDRNKEIREARREYRDDIRDGDNRRSARREYRGEVRMLVANFVGNVVMHGRIIEIVHFADQTAATTRIEMAVGIIVHTAVIIP